MKLRLTVVDIHGNRLYCRILLSEKSSAKTNGKIRMENICCEGEFDFLLDQGLYELTITRGGLYQPFNKMIQMLDKDIILETRLDEILDTRSLNLYSFDAHSHVSRDAVLETGNLVTASTVMKAEGFNFFLAGSPYDHETHMQYLNDNFTDKVPYREKYAPDISKESNDHFILDIGNEIVKCRYGHFFLMNYTQNPPFSKYYDHQFDPWLFTKTGGEPDYRISYPYEALIRERGENSVAVAAHPTSWWWHDNGEFITNIAATLGFEILAGSIDAMVIMGYRSDHKYYQELWYEVLKNGYFLPGVAETDAAFDTNSDNKLSFKTYAFMDEFSMDALCRSVRAGRNIVSSGPILIMKVNGRLPGEVFEYTCGESFTVELEAFRSHHAPLSKVQIIMNGDLYKEYDIQLGSFQQKEIVHIQEDSFILAKCYDFSGNVAITNPVYMRNKPFANKGYLSDVRITVSKDGNPAKGIYWLDDENERIPFVKEIPLKMKVSSRLNILVDGQLRIIRLFELEELQEIFKNLYFGRFNTGIEYQPGEVPAEHFKIAHIRKILDKVELHVDFDKPGVGS